MATRSFRFAAAVLVALAAVAHAADKPKVPPGVDHGGVAVAVIDSGVDYTAPQIAKRLARDGEGDIIGLDFEDRDNQPFDQSGSGTSLAGVILNEAPGARLVPVRQRAGDIKSLAGAIAFVASGPARIVLMTAATKSKEEWEPVRALAISRPDILFVLPAGDEGSNMDAEPRWPTAFGWANMIVVTAADAGGQLSKGANIGPKSVDIAITADSSGMVPGSHHAAARVSALAARLKAAEPSLDGPALKHRIVSTALRFASSVPSTRHGWIK